MDSVREKITIELARSKIRTEEIYSIIKDIADHIEPPKAVPVAKPAPAPKSQRTSTHISSCGPKPSTALGHKNCSPWAA